VLYISSTSCVGLLTIDSRSHTSYVLPKLIILIGSVPHPPTPAVPEGLFDDSVDLVVWGHEHDCRIVPEPVAGRPYHVIQPGSSVATSLGEGEGIEK